MLILTRRINEKLVIDFNGKKVEVSVLGIKGNQVRIGCNADRDVEIHREEIWNKIKREEESENNQSDENDQSDYDSRGSDYY